MSSKKQTRENRMSFNLGIDVEKENAESLAERLGIKTQQKTVVLREEVLNHLNRPCDSEGNTYLMKFAEHGKDKVLELLLKCDGLEVNSKNCNRETASDISWNEDNYSCLLRLLEADSLFPRYIGFCLVDETKPGGIELMRFVEKRRSLHDKIVEGDLDYVKEHTKSNKSSYYLNLRNKSAVYCAAKNENFQLCAYLQYIGVKFWQGERSKLMDKIEIDKQEQLQAAASAYFIEDKDSHIYKLMASSKIYGLFTDDRKEIVDSLYRKLNQCQHIRMVMKVLKDVDLDVIFDFDSYEIDRICPNTEEDTYGLADSKIQRIYIGTQACLSDNSPDKAVLGTLAHELSHLAMQAVYGNNARPFKRDDTDKMEEYNNIIRTVEEVCNRKPKDIDDVIKRVFDYDRWAWEAELIVRVPHLLGIHGEKEGMRLLREQVPELLDFYARSVDPDYEKYSNYSFFEKPLCLIDALQKYHGCIQEMEDGMSPLKELNEKFKDSLNYYENISVLVTSDTKLCCWQVYNELKDIYKFHLSRCCLFFEIKRFQSNSKTILNAFQCNACKYLVLVTNEMHPNFSEISDFFSYIENTEEKIVILIVKKSCSNLENKWKSKAVEYDLNHLSEPFKSNILRKKILYQGVSVALEEVGNVATDSKIINPDVLFYLLNEENIRIGYGSRLLSPGYNRETYIARTFVMESVDEDILKVENKNYHFFVTGITKGNLLKRGIEEKEIHIIERDNDPLKTDKKIILAGRDGTERETFTNLCENKKCVSFHWLCYLNGVFYWRMSLGGERLSEMYLIKEEVEEDGLIKASHERKDRVILISGDAGTGKSTVISDLIRKAKGPDVWLARINFNDHADLPNNPKSLANIKEGGKPKDVMDYFFRILNLQNQLEYSLLKSFLTRDCRVKVFVDGFDEITPFYKDKALTLMRTLMNETRIQMWVTTRQHERVDLETVLGVSSYSLRPYSLLDQATYLGKFWMNKLRSSCELTFYSKENVQTVRDKIKAIVAEMRHSLSREEYKKIFGSLSKLSGYIRMKEDINEVKVKDQLQEMKSLIQNLNFTSYAGDFLDEMSSSIGDKKRIFTGLPLHLNMLAEVSYHENLKIGPQSNIYYLYSEFVDKKVEIYLKQKVKNILKTVANMYIQDREKKRILDCHREISKCVVDPDRYKLDSIQKSDVFEYIDRIGLVTKLGKGHFQFLHLTFAEYFFSEYITESITEDTLEKGLLESVLLSSGSKVIRVFINSNLQSMKNKISFGENFYRDFDISDVFYKYFQDIDEEDIKTSIHIWEGILRSLESHSSQRYMNEFTNRVEKVVKRLKESVIMEFVSLLGSSLSNAIFLKIFCSRKYVEYLFPIFQNEPLKNLEGFIKAAFCCGSEDEKLPSTECQPVNAGEVIETDELIKNPEAIQRATMLFDARGSDGLNIFHYACNNADVEVLTLLTGYFKRNFTEDDLMEHITKINSSNDSILHECVKRYTVRKVLKALQSRMSVDKFAQLIMWVNDSGRNFIHNMAEGVGSEELIHTLNYLGECVEIRILDEILIKRDKKEDTILLLASKNEQTGALVEVLSTFQGCMSEDYFSRLIMGVDGNGCNFLHCVSPHRNLDESELALLYLRESFDSRLFDELLCQKNGSGYIFLDLSSDYKDAGVFLLILETVKLCMSEYKFFDFIRELKLYTKNFLKYATDKTNVCELNMSIRFLRKFSDLRQMQEILLQRDEDGFNLLHIASNKEDIRLLDGILKAAKSYTSQEELKKFVMSVGKGGQTVFHLRAESEYNLTDLKILQHYIDKEDMRELISKPNDYGETCVHLICNEIWRCNKLCVLFDSLRFVSAVLNPKQFKMFVLSENQDGDTFLHICAQLVHVMDYSSIVEVLVNNLSEKDYQKLIDSSNSKGDVVRIVEDDGKVELRLVRTLSIQRLLLPYRTLMNWFQGPR